MEFKVGDKVKYEQASNHSYFPRWNFDTDQGASGKYRTGTVERILGVTIRVRDDVDGYGWSFYPKYLELVHVLPKLRLVDKGSYYMTEKI